MILPQHDCKFAMPKAASKINLSLVFSCPRFLQRATCCAACATQYGVALYINHTLSPDTAVPGYGSPATSARSQTAPLPKPSTRSIIGPVNASTSERQTRSGKTQLVRFQCESRNFTPHNMKRHLTLIIYCARISPPLCCEEKE